MDWKTIATALLPVAIGLAFMWGKANKILKAMKELGDVLIVIPEALLDQKLSKEEIEDIKEEIAEALLAFKDVLK